MRRFLYISPYFPPQRKVGALRPLKFVRYLPEYGWDPIVVCDLSPSDAMDRSLVDAIPPETEVIRDYGRFARFADRRFQQGSLPRPQHRKGQDPRIRRLPIRPVFNPELVTLGGHSLDIRHACRTGRKRLKKGDCEAIMVNADPFAALLVGRRLSLEFDLPLILDLRDPWAPCDIRRRLRPLPQLRLVDRLERRTVESTAKVILTTQAALKAYRSHYPDLPADRFALIRNFGDPELAANGSFPERNVFTLLFLGSFRRFIEGEQLVFALAELRRRGFDGSHCKLLITGNIIFKTQALARKLGVDDMIEHHPFVPYGKVCSFMETSDLLVLIGHRTRQRIPAKLYDYIQSKRPILAISDNPEISHLAERIGGITVSGLDDIDGTADAIQDALELGRDRTVMHDTEGLDRSTAVPQLAKILDEACSG